MIPRFIHLLEDQTVFERNTAEFACKIHPVNAPVTWQMDGKDVTDDDKFVTRIENGYHHLVIKDVREEDEKPVSAILESADSHANLWVEGVCQLQKYMISAQVLNIYVKILECGFMKQSRK